MIHGIVLSSVGIQLAVDILLHLEERDVGMCSGGGKRKRDAEDGN